MWRELLTQAVAVSSRTKVAEALGYSTTTISLVMNEKYPGGTEKIAARVVEVFGKVHCPYVGADIPCAQCGDMARQAAPTNNPARLRHWKACQTCPKNPTRENRDE